MEHPISASRRSGQQPNQQPAEQPGQQAEQQALARMLAHHQELSSALALKVEVVVTSARAGSHDAADQARLALVHWCRRTLMPYADAQEATIHRVAGEIKEGRLLIEAMAAEHRLMGDVIDQLEECEDAIGAAPLAASLRMLVETHLAKENNQVLPLLMDAAEISLSPLCDEVLRSAEDGSPVTDPVDDGYGHPVHEPGTCRCSEIDLSGVPEFDARPVAHAIRHATVFGALDAVPAGSALVLVAPHEPVPLLAQLQRRQPDVFSIEYLQRGPDVWRLLLTRTTR